MVQIQSQRVVRDERAPRDEDVDTFGLTDVGKVRRSNEDQFLVSSLHKQMEVRNTSLPNLEELPLTSDAGAYLALVADGVGGHAGGQEASQAASEHVARYVMHSMRCYYTRDPHEENEFLKELHKGVLTAHELVVIEADKHPERKGMATTLTMVMVIWPRAYLVQVGDSRCYKLRDRELHQVTRDQTLAQELVDQGLLRKSQAGRSPMQHILSSAIGGSEARPVVSKIDLEWDDVLLLCTDGLTNAVPDDLIRERLISLDSSEQACRQLVKDALDHGGRDNVTVVVGRLRPRLP